MAVMAKPTGTSRILTDGVHEFPAPCWDNPTLACYLFSALCMSAICTKPKRPTSQTSNGLNLTIHDVVSDRVISPATCRRHVSSPTRQGVKILNEKQAASRPKPRCQSKCHALCCKLGANATKLRLFVLGDIFPVFENLDVAREQRTVGRQVFRSERPHELFSDILLERLHRGRRHLCKRRWCDG